MKHLVVLDPMKNSTIDLSQNYPNPFSHLSVIAGRITAARDGIEIKQNYWGKGERKLASTAPKFMFALVDLFHTH